MDIIFQIYLTFIITNLYDILSRFEMLHTSVNRMRWCTLISLPQCQVAIIQLYKSDSYKQCSFWLAHQFVFAAIQASDGAENSQVITGCSVVTGCSAEMQKIVACEQVHQLSLVCIKWTSSMHSITRSFKQMQTWEPNGSSILSTHAEMKCRVFQCSNRDVAT